MGAEMNPGLMNKKLQLLRADGAEDIIWQPVSIVWAKVVEGKTGLAVPLAARSPAIEITMRETDITEADAVTFNSNHYLVTSVIQDTEHPVYLKVTAVQAPAYTADIYRPVKTKDSMNATIWNVEKIGSSVCSLFERYVTAKDERGHGETSTALIMVTPKSCILKEGDSIDVLGSRWKVTACYQMDQYKNRCQIEKVVDN